jgi:hypothetical protein
MKCRVAKLGDRKVVLAAVLLAALQLPVAAETCTWKADPRLSRYTNKLLLRDPAVKDVKLSKGPLTCEQLAAVKRELDTLSYWLTNSELDFYFRTKPGFEHVGRFLMDRWVLILLQNAGSTDAGAKNLWSDGKVNYDRALASYHSLMTSSREMTGKDFTTFFTIDDTVVGTDPRDLRVRTIEHFATAAHASYTTGAIPSHLASLFWNTYSETRRQLEGVYDTSKLPKEAWGEEMNHSLVTESAASFWARSLPGAKTASLSGVSKVLFFDDFMKDLGKQPMSVLVDFGRYLGGQKL